MTDKEIIERAKEAEKRTCFGELVHSPISKGVNSAFGIGFIEGMVEYRNSLQEPASIDFEQELYKAFGQVKDFTLGMRIAKWFYDMGKNSQEPVSEDLELSWEDIPKIFQISEELKTSWWFRDNEQTKKIGTQIFWEEVLKRFRELRNVKQEI
jgi:hypothetical protein